MSLIAWYKLDGNALDSSGNGLNLTTNTATSTTAGKIGGCYTFASGNAISVTSGINLPHNASFTAWAYNNNAFAGSMMIFSCNSTLYSGPDLHFSGAIVWNTGDGNGNPFKKNGVNVVYPSSNAWHHYAVVNNQELNKAFLYIDGEYYGEATYRNTFQENRGFTIGNYTPGNTGYAWAGMIDDVRIYNHLLTEKEIKELAKAKVLHYTFDEFQEPTENIVTNTNLETGWSMGYNKDILWNDISPPAGVNSQVVSFIDSDGNGSGYWYCYGDYAPQTPSTTYTISVYARTIGSSWSMYAYTADNSEIGRQSTNILTVPGDGNWHRLVFNPIFNPANSQSDSLSFNFSNIPSGQRCWLCAPQMEAKDHATPFVNGTRTGSVSDNSGYDNHADLALATTPQWTEDSRIGKGAYKFDGSQYFYVTPYPKNTQEQTVSFWAYALDWQLTSSRSFLSCTEGGGWNVWLSGSVVYIEWYIAGAYRTANFSKTGISAGWHMISISYDGQYLKSYLDGEIKTTTSITGTIQHTKNKLYIGAENNNDVNGVNPFSGYIDDVRIYATALSADDVKELYNTRAQIDDKGNFFANQVDMYSNYKEEINNTNLIENGCQEYKSNYNNTGFTYLPSENCLSLTSGSTQTVTSNYIPIQGNGLDSFDSYILEGEIKGRDYQSRYYYMLYCYNKYFQEISNEQVNVRGGTATTLTQNLVSGQTQVHLADLTNWYDDGTTNYSHAKTLALWHPNDEYLFTPLKYSKRILNVGKVDKVNKILTLTSAYSGETIPSGSLAQNHQSGSTYSYIAASNDLTNLSDWEFKRSGATSTSANVGVIRYGTSYVRVGFLINRNAVGGTPTTLVRNMRFYNITNGQQMFSEFNQPKINTNGAWNSSEISELGPTNGLVAYYPLNGDAKDYANTNDGTVNGAIISAGINGKACYSFDGVDDSIQLSKPIIGIWDSSFTFSTWAKATSGSGRGLLLGDFSTANALSVNIEWNSSSLRLYWAGSPDINAPLSLAYDTWTFLTIVRDKQSSQVRFYKDGVLGYTYSGDLVDKTATTNLHRIGSDGRTGEPVFNGYIQNMRLYNRALSPEEISILYDLEKGDTIKVKMDKNTLYIGGQIYEG